MHLEPTIKLLGMVELHFILRTGGYLEKTSNIVIYTLVIILSNIVIHCRNISIFAISFIELFSTFRRFIDESCRQC